MGIALQYVCRNNTKLHEAIVNIEADKVDKEGGIDEVITVLDRLHNINQKQSMLQSYEIFENLNRKEEQSIPEFILEFENLVAKIKKNGQTLSDDLLAFQLLKKVNLSEAEERMIRASTTEFNLENLKDTLKRSYGDSKTSCRSQINIKEEPSFQAIASEGHSKESCGEEYTFYTQKWNKNINKMNQFPQNKLNQGKNNKNKVLKYPIPPGRNPLDRYGYMTHCNVCYSVNHWQAECPDKQQTYNKNNVGLYQVVLFEEDVEEPDRVKSLTYETLNSAVLDPGCSRTVC